MTTPEAVSYDAPSIYEGIPQIWIDASGMPAAATTGQFLPPYAFNQRWHEITGNIPVAKPAWSDVPGDLAATQRWNSPSQEWPSNKAQTCYLTAKYMQSAISHTETLELAWNTHYYHDIVDTLVQQPFDTAIIQAVIRATAHTNRRGHNPSSFVCQTVSMRPVLSSNKPPRQQMNRYKTLQHAPYHTLRLPFQDASYRWHPTGNVFIAGDGTSGAPDASHAEVVGQDFFAIAQAIAGLLLTGEDRQ